MVNFEEIFIFPIHSEVLCIETIAHHDLLAGIFVQQCSNYIARHKNEAHSIQNSGFSAVEFFEEGDASVEDYWDQGYQKNREYHIINLSLIHI